jgi:hypothetical protein
MWVFKKSFYYLMGKTKEQIIAEFGKNYLDADDTFYYTLNMTWFTKGKTLSIKFNTQEKVEEVDLMKNDSSAISRAIANLFDFLKLNIKF